MNSLPEKILDKLQAAPFSVAEISFDLGERAAGVGRVKAAIASLLSAGAIVRLRTRREGGPFYCLPGYREPTTRRNHEDLRQVRSYAHHYERQDGELDL